MFMYATRLVHMMPRRDIISTIHNYSPFNVIFFIFRLYYVKNKTMFRLFVKYMLNYNIKKTTNNSGFSLQRISFPLYAYFFLDSKKKSVI